MPKWIACVDYTDGDDRESWSVFYVEMFVADTEEEAKWLGDYHLALWMNDEFDEEGQLPEYGDVCIRQENTSD